MWQLSVTEDGTCEAHSVAMVPRLPARFGHRAAAVPGRNDAMVVVGGSGPDALTWTDRCLVIYPDLNTWRPIQLEVGKRANFGFAFPL